MSLGYSVGWSSARAEYWIGHLAFYPLSVVGDSCKDSIRKFFLKKRHFKLYCIVTNLTVLQWYIRPVRSWWLQSECAGHCSHKWGDHHCHPGFYNIQIVSIIIIIIGGLYLWILIDIIIEWQYSFFIIMLYDL